MLTDDVYKLTASGRAKARRECVLLVTLCTCIFSTVLKYIVPRHGSYHSQRVYMYRHRHRHVGAWLKEKVFRTTEQAHVHVNFFKLVIAKLIEKMFAHDGES